MTSFWGGSRRNQILIGMLITEKKLRQMVRSSLIGEAPLDDIITYDVGDRPEFSWHRNPRPSIAHRETRPDPEDLTDEKYMGIARDLMSSTRDNWVIVTPSDTRNWHITSNSAKFHDWIKAQRAHHPPGTIFAIATMSPLGGDHNAPEWTIVHDLLGHSIEQNWSRFYGYKFDSVPLEIVGALHDQLPSKYRVSDDVDDQLPDILAAILLGHLTRDQARDAVEQTIVELRLSESERESLRLTFDSIVDSMFDAVKAWLYDARTDGFVELRPWG